MGTRTNENTNSLIRHFFPKSTRFDQLTDDEVQVVRDNLKNRPRKKLGFLTPLEENLETGMLHFKIEPKRFDNDIILYLKKPASEQKIPY